jgi:hypothetical protein
MWIKSILILLSLPLAIESKVDSYDRKDFNYQSYKPSTAIGFHTSKTCDLINIDHVVSLKDAYESGASFWGASKKKAFANDTDNHVCSCVLVILG